MSIIKTALEFYGHAGKQRASSSTAEDPLDPKLIGDPGAEFPPPPLAPANFGYPTHISLHQGQTASFDVRIASIVGRSHANAATTREDGFAIQSCGGGAIAVAVADGLGDRAARYSHIGSAACAAAAVKALTDKTWLHSDRGQLIGQITDEMMLRAPQMHAAGAHGDKLTAADLRCTLTAVRIEPDGTFAGFSVGDSGIGQLGSDGWQQLPSPALGYSNVLTATFPLTSEGYRGSKSRLDSPHEGRLATGDVLLLATDGVLDPLQDSALASELASGWRSPPLPPKFLAQLSFIKRGENDDRTAAVVWFKHER